MMAARPCSLVSLENRESSCEECEGNRHDRQAQSRVAALASWLPSCAAGAGSVPVLLKASS